MVYKIRVILNAEEDAIRDIAIEADSSLEDLHNAITNAFGFDGAEMASFYTSDNEWNQGEEIPLFDMEDETEEKITMDQLGLGEKMSAIGSKMIYVYDFFNMWTFYVELIENDLDHPDSDLPFLLFSLGNIPNQAPELNFEADPSTQDAQTSDEDDLDDEFDEDINADFDDFRFN